VLGDLFENVDTTDAEGAAKAAEKPNGSPVCPSCSLAVRDSGATFGDTWTLTAVRLEDGPWLRVLAGRIV
jgi:hypothetical protein